MPKDGSELAAKSLEHRTYMILNVPKTVSRRSIYVQCSRRNSVTLIKTGIQQSR